MTEDGSIYAIKRLQMFDVDSATKEAYLEEIKLLERLQKYDAIIRMSGALSFAPNMFQS